ncbi:MAG: RHS repeat-associated core domain-containing protein [archaeon]
MNKNGLKWFLLLALFIALIIPVNANCDGDWGERIVTNENTYIYGNNQRIAMKTTEKPSEVYYFHSDNLGSTSVMSNSKGKKIAEENYSVFGEVLSSNGGNPTDFFFTGKELDKGTGLYYYGARYYDPNTGRFISADSFSGRQTKPQTQNKYTYTSNNPLKYVDPTGMEERLAQPQVNLGSFGQRAYVGQVGTTDWGTMPSKMDGAMFGAQMSAFTITQGPGLLADTKAWETLNVPLLKHVHGFLKGGEDWTVEQAVMLGRNDYAVGAKVSFGLVRAIMSPIGLASMGLLSVEAAAEVRAAHAARAVAISEAELSYTEALQWRAYYLQTGNPLAEVQYEMALSRGISGREFAASIEPEIEKIVGKHLAKEAAKSTVKQLFPKRSWWWNAEQNPWLVPATQ